MPLLHIHHILHILLIQDTHILNMDTQPPKHLNNKVPLTTTNPIIHPTSHNEDDIKIIQPFLQYLICASQGINVKTIPALSFSEEEVNNNVVNSSNGIMPNLLSSTHKVEKRINEINNNSKSFGEELFNEWMKNGQHGAKFGKYQEPTAEQLFPFVTQPTFNYVQNNRPNIQEDTIENKDDSMNLDDNFDDNNNNNNINIESIIQQLKNNVTNVKYIVKNQKNVLRHGFWFLNDGFNVCMILDNPYNDKAKQCIWNLTWKLIHLEQNYLQVTHMYQNKQIILNITFLDEQEFKLWKIVCNHFSNFIQ